MSARACGIVLAGLTACLIRSWNLGEDGNWDLLNYHLYNGLALLDGSFRSDVAAAGIQTYLNPLIDLPLGFAVRALGHHWGLILHAAIVQFLCYAAVWRLACGLVVPRSRSLSAGMTALALVGSGAASLAFTNFGDWIVAGLLCEACRAVVLVWRADSEGDHGSAVALCGILAGLAVGLKLTAAPFAVGVAAGIVVSFGFRALALSLVSMFGGFLLTAGPWMWFLTERFGSPVFPFYNAIFHAPSASRSSFDDPRFGATSIGSFIKFPVSIARGTAQYSEFPYQEWRFLVLCVMTVAFLVLRRPSWRELNPRALFIFIVLIVSYLIWLLQFGIYRYFLFGEILASFILVLLTSEFIRGSRGLLCATLAAALVGLAIQQSTDWGRAVDLGSDELQAASDGLNRPITVVFSASPPTSYLKLSLPDGTRLVSLAPFANGDLVDEGRIGRDIDRAIDQALETESLYVIVEPGATEPLPPLSDLALYGCTTFSSAGRDLEFCSATRVEDS